MTKLGGTNIGTTDDAEPNEKLMIVNRQPTTTMNIKETYGDTTGHVTTNDTLMTEYSLPTTFAGDGKRDIDAEEYHTEIQQAGPMKMKDAMKKAHGTQANEGRITGNKGDMQERIEEMTNMMNQLRAKPYEIGKIVSESPRNVCSIVFDSLQENSMSQAKRIRDITKGDGELINKVMTAVGTVTKQELPAARVYRAKAGQ